MLQNFSIFHIGKQNPELLFPSELISKRETKMKKITLSFCTYVQNTSYLSSIFKHFAISSFHQARNTAYKQLLNKIYHSKILVDLLLRNVNKLLRFQDELMPKMEK